MCVYVIEDWEYVDGIHVSPLPTNRSEFDGKIA